jgi:hypothetical protein
MKLLLTIFGVLLLLLGVHWIGQGTGYFPWPRNPVMDNQPAWIWYGAATAVVGIIVIRFSRSR